MIPIVLVVSDDTSKLALIKKGLKGRAHLLERPNGSSALELLKNTTIDLIILDAKLKDPLKIAEELREAAPILEVPLILITGNLKKVFIESALKAGVTDFLNEPLEKEEIEQRFAVAIKTKHRSKEIVKLAQSIGPWPTQKPLAERKFLNDQIVKEVVKARKISKMISLLSIESDRLSGKDLATLMSTLEQHLRKNDALIPQSPGKLVLILPKTSHRAAEIIAETLRAELTSLPVTITLIDEKLIEALARTNFKSRQ